MRHYLELRKLRKTERNLTKRYRELTQTLRAKKIDDDDFQSATDELRMAIQECSEDREYLYHRELQQKAERLFISLPERTAKDIDEGGDPDSDEYWLWLPVTDRWVLRPKGIRQVRSEIREELKAGRDYLLGWISPFVGIISVLIGAAVGYLLGRKVP